MTARQDVQLDAVVGPVGVNLAGFGYRHRCVVAAVLFGDGLRDAFDPKLKN